LVRLIGSLGLYPSVGLHPQDAFHAKRSSSTEY